MTKNRELWKGWESGYQSGEGVDFFQNLRLLEGMYEEARYLGAFPLRDPWEGLEIRIKLARRSPSVLKNDPSLDGHRRTDLEYVRR